MTGTEGHTASRVQQLQLVCGAIGAGCAVAAVLTVVVSAGQWWKATPQRASLAGVQSAVVEPPEPLRGGEAYVETRALPTGDLLVTHWIESDNLLFAIRLARPRVPGAREVAAEDVRVVANGRTVTGPEHVSGKAARYAFLGTLSVQISYRLTGATELSSSAPGRALARPTALDVSYEPESERVTRAVIAPEVLSLACSPPASFTPIRPCGTRGPDGEWTAELFGSAAGDQVIAQLTLE